MNLPLYVVAISAAFLMELTGTPVASHAMYAFIIVAAIKDRTGWRGEK